MNSLLKEMDSSAEWLRYQTLDCMYFSVSQNIASSHQKQYSSEISYAPIREREKYGALIRGNLSKKQQETDKV